VQNKALLTFDIEEFDIPLEYGYRIPFERQIEVTTSGLRSILALLAQHNISCTFFTTSAYAQQQPELMREISRRHEIASHGNSHSSFSVADLASSKATIETIINKPVYGFRRARFASVDDLEVEKAGYIYNSSLNPTWIPGKYNYLDKPRIPFTSGTLFNIPISVTPLLRIPLFWLSVKNLPMWLFELLMTQTLKHDGLLSLYIHPWEFVEIKDFGLPWFISRNGGKEMLNRVDRIINVLKPDADFLTMHDFCEQQLRSAPPTSNTPPK
jgi:peptidoglycan/xylan/chitin deacetylase (PgdA/CDA1 family)